MKEFNFDKVNDIQDHLDKHHYIADRNLSTSLFLALKMKKPIFLEGEPGVGKTEVGKVLAKIMNTDLIRLQNKKYTPFPQSTLTNRTRFY